jgi:hypothetical protein
MNGVLGVEGVCRLICMYIPWHGKEWNGQRFDFDLALAPLVTAKNL